MTTFKEDITSDLDDVFFNTDEMAEAITYSTSSIEAIVKYGPNLDVDADSAREVCTITVKRSDVATFAVKTSVTIGSDTWRTKREIKADAYARTIELEKAVRPRLR